MDLNYDKTKDQYFSILSRIRETFEFVEEKEEGECHYFSISRQEHPEKYLIFTSGLHGVEGYSGTEIIILFMEHYLSEIDFSKVGIIFINFINAYGMKTGMRVNENRIDLNRNFADFEISSDFNGVSRRSKLPHKFLSGTWTRKNQSLNQLKFILEVLPLYFSRHWQSVMNTFFMGQYLTSDYPFYGGNTLEVENLRIINWLRPIFESDAEIVLLDLHTGIGDFGQMTLILDAHENERVFLWKMKLGFPNVFKTGEGEMYDVSGDFTGYWYRQFPSKKYCGITVEFGVKKKHVFSSFLSVMELVIENGMVNKDYDYDRSKFVNLFYTSNPKWWYKTKEQFDLGIKGIIRYFDL